MDQLIALSGAIALLLWGIRMVKTGAERFFGGKLDSYFRTLTKNRASSFSMGFGITCLLQSSTATLLMSSGFYASGALTLCATLAIVLGAESASSLLPLLFSLPVKEAAPLLLLAGYICFTVSSQRRGKHIGRILLGVGMMLLSLKLMGHLQHELEPVFPLINKLALHDPLLTIILMALLTWLMHSSVASVLLITGMASESVLNLNSTLILLLGVHLGAGLPALSSGWCQGIAVRKILLANVVFRAVCCLTGYLMLQKTLELSAQSALPIPVQGTLFYLSSTLICCLLILLFLPKIARKIESIHFGPLTRISELSSTPIYLKQADTSNPSRALANASNEAFRAADITYQMLSNSLQAFNNDNLIGQILLLDDHLDNLHRETTLYLASIGKIKDNESRDKEALSIFSFFTNLEHVGDIVSRSTMLLAKRKHKKLLEFSDEGQAELDWLHGQLLEIFKLSQAVFSSGDVQLAEELLQAKRQYRQELIAARKQHIDRLRSGNGASIASSQIHLDILRDFRSICSYLSMVAYPIHQPKQAFIEGSKV